MRHVLENAGLWADLMAPRGLAASLLLRLSVTRAVENIIPETKLFKNFRRNQLMVTYVVWVDMDHSKIFKIASPRQDRPRLLRRREIKHHTSRDPENHKDCEKFFHEIAHEIRDADEILLTGPSLAKDHFKAHLERHHHEGLARKVVGTRTLERVSNNLILAQSREFFKTYDIYGSSLPA